MAGAFFLYGKLTKGYNPSLVTEADSAEMQQNETKSEAVPAPDFTVYDAIRAGFNKIIFIIKEENEDLFEKTFGFGHLISSRILCNAAIIPVNPGKSN